MKKIIISLLSLLTMAAISGWAGWYFGMRDGITLANCEISTALVSYHIARAHGDTNTIDRIMEELTGNTVSYVLDGRHSFPLYHTFPYRSQDALSRLRAVWTPRANHFGSQLKYPHRNPYAKDYRAEFEAISPATNVAIAPRYLSR